MISMPGSASTSWGNVGPHMLSRAVVVATIGSFNALAAFARATTLWFQLAGRIVADTSHEADLMIDEDEHGVFGSQGLIGADLISHRILLGFSRYDLQRSQWCERVSKTPLPVFGFALSGNRSDAPHTVADDP